MRSLILLLLTGVVTAAEPDTATQDAAALTTAVKPVLLKQLKSPTLDTRHHWGQQKEFVTGFDVKRESTFRWTRTPIVEKKNDGTWTHFTLDVPDPAKNLHLEITELKTVEAGKMTFKMALRSQDVHLRIEQQIWKRGVRLVSNETRATCTAAVHLECEVTTRLETSPGRLLPETVVAKAKVTQAEIYHQDLKVQHTLGVGGDAARIIGEATLKLIHQFKPDLEKDLIAKANAAIVKAGELKEVRVNLSRRQ